MRKWIFIFFLIAVVSPSFVWAQSAFEIEDRFELPEAAVFPDRSFVIRKWQGEPVSQLSDLEIAQVFQSLASSNLPFRYAKDCCHDRAHKMSYWMDQHGILSLKVFVFGNLRLRTTQGPEVQWEFHVAPALMNLQGQIVVLDPSVSDRPLELKAWLRRFSKPTQKIRIQAGSRFTYTPGDLELKRTTWDESEMKDLVDLSLMGCKAIENRNRSQSTGSLPIDQ